jgi:peroxiredoxin
LVIERIDTHIDETDIKANDERSEHLENNKINTISVDTTIT